MSVDTRGLVWRRNCREPIRKSQKAGLSAVACPAANARIAVGFYGERNGAGSDQGLIETLSDKTWTAARAPLPANAATAKKADVSFEAAACPAIGNCVVAGSGSGVHPGW